MAAKKTSKKKPSKSKPTKSILNKSPFIRANPTLSTAELVAKGKKMGLEISTAYVYTLRSSDRAKAGKAPVKTSSGGGVDVGNGRAPKASRDLEGILIDAVVDLGGKTVQELLQAAISRVKATAKNK